MRINGVCVCVCVVNRACFDGANIERTPVTGKREEKFSSIHAFELCIDVHFCHLFADELGTFCNGLGANNFSYRCVRALVALVVFNWGFVSSQRKKISQA
jgi:hypothetical protein